MTPVFSNPRWMILGAAVACVVVLGSFVAWRHHQATVFAGRVYDAERTVDMLRPVVAADARFQNVSVSMTTGPGVFLTGTVASTDDWEALHRLVEQTSTPFHASLSVGLDANPPNTALEPTATRH